MFDVKRFTTHDGPGIRTTVFLKGCPLSCAWCHNPESQARAPEVFFERDRCAACGACVAACQRRAIAIRSEDPRGTPPSTDRSRCVGCGACVAACAPHARRLVGRVRSADEVVSELERDLLFYEQSGGGVTLSGGEPLAQPEFAAAILRRCRSLRLHTAVDTCGEASREALDRVAEDCDLFLFDLKLIDGERHRRWTGAPNERIFASLERLLCLGKRVWIRCPLVPGVNDSVDDARALGRFVGGLAGVEAVQLLPYHAAGEGKLARLERSSPLGDVRPPDSASVARTAQIVQALSGIPVTVGG